MKKLIGFLGNIWDKVRCIVYPMRYLMVVVIAFTAIIVVVNLPVLGKAMMTTITEIPLSDWAKYIGGAIIGSVAMWFAKGKKRVSRGKMKNSNSAMKNSNSAMNNSNSAMNNPTDNR